MIRRSNDYTNLEKRFDNLTGKRLIGRELDDIKKINAKDAGYTIVIPSYGFV